VTPILCIAPYLPLREPLRIGPWHLLPLGDASTVLSGDDLELARRFGGAYGIGRTDRHGAIGYRRASSPFAAVSTQVVHRLNLALLCGVLDANDGSTRPTYTAENALVFAHPVGDPRFAAYEEGALLTTLRGVPLDGTARIHPPAELVIANTLARSTPNSLARSTGHSQLGRRGAVSS